MYQRYRFVGEDTALCHKIDIPTSKPTIRRTHPEFELVFIMYIVDTNVEV